MQHAAAVRRAAMDGGRKEYTFFWSVENYSYCWLKNGEKLFSSPFTAGGLESTDWRLELFPRGRRVEDKGFTSLYLYRNASNDGPECIPIQFELSVLAEDGSVLSSKEYDHSFGRWSNCGDADFLKMDKTLFQKSFPRDILTVRCKMWKGEGDVDRVTPIHARTRIGVENVSFLHEVKDFSFLQPNQKNNIGTRTPPTTKAEAIASSSLYFTFDSCRDGEMLVEITPSDSSHFLCERKISLLQASGNETVCAVEDYRFHVDRNDIQTLPLSLTRRDILKKKSEYLPDDKLTLKCECRFYTGLEFIRIEETPYEITEVIPKRKISLDSTKEEGIKVEKAAADPSGLKDMTAMMSSKME